MSVWFQILAQMYMDMLYYPKKRILLKPEICFKGSFKHSAFYQKLSHIYPFKKALFKSINYFLFP